MSLAPLVLREFSGSIEVTESAKELKSKALTAAKPIKKVETVNEQQVAVEALRDLKAIRTGIESARKSVKAPVLELGRKIDALASDFLQECYREEMRLQGLVNHYQRKQLQISRAEEAQITQRAKQADELNLEAQELRHNSVFEPDLDSKRAMLKRAEEIEAQALDAKLTAETIEVPEVAKPKGLVVRQRINFQVIDALVFTQAWPQFWKVSANGDHQNERLVVDRQKVLDELNAPNRDGVFHKTRFPEELSQTEDQALVQPAGLRGYDETKSHVR